MNDLDEVYAFAVSLGIGLLLGLERQRKPQGKAGLRTFGLTAILGTACSMLTAHAGTPWLLPAGFIACALVMIAAAWQDPSDRGDVTTTIALLLCFTYGATLWYGHTLLIVALALATMALLYFKTELHDVSSKFSHEDMVSLLQFAVITFIVLPLLPDQGYGPYETLNPRTIWKMVVLITGIGLAGYVALRLVGTDRGAPLLGILGGMISSTATTLVFARKARVARNSASSAQMIILVANLVLLLRIAFVAAVVTPSALRGLAPVLALGFVCGAVVPIWLWRKTRGKSSGSDLPAKNPVELLPALTFGVIFAITLLLTAWLNDTFGAAGIYALAPILGLTDMDAITLSALKLFGAGSLNGAQLAATVVLALTANLAFKGGVAAAVGGRELGVQVAIGFLAVLAGLLAGLAIAWVA